MPDHPDTNGAVEPSISAMMQLHWQHCRQANLACCEFLFSCLQAASRQAAMKMAGNYCTAPEAT
jgi:hypothetical protein